jgi:NADH dehydrogenase FAD-containing subunit
MRRAAGVLITQERGQIEADIVILATGLLANTLVQKMGLPAHPREGLRVNARLHSVADERVFAAGDCAHMDGFTLPKLGILGVRQARFIHGNILARLDGGSLRAYEPQKRHLAILNLGDGTALSTWGFFWFIGPASMWLKNRIDRRFLDQYRRGR